MGSAKCSVCGRMYSAGGLLGDSDAGIRFAASLIKKPICPDCKRASKFSGSNDSGGGNNSRESEANAKLVEAQAKALNAQAEAEAKAREMFHKASAIRFMTEVYEVSVKEMIFAALARREEVYIPVFCFNGQISNLGNVRKMSDKSPVGKFLIDGREAVAFDLVYGKDEGDVKAFDVKSLFDSILYPIAKGWAVEGEED